MSRDIQISFIPLATYSQKIIARVLQSPTKETETARLLPPLPNTKMVNGRVTESLRRTTLKRGRRCHCVSLFLSGIVAINYNTSK